MAHELFNGKYEVNLKELFEIYNSTSDSSQKKKLARIISTKKQKYIDGQNYVGIIHMVRYLSDYEKDRLFLGLLKDHPNASLFVLAFAGSDMHSYKQAYKIEHKDHDNDEEALRKDIELIFDSTLCKFISEHETKEDLEYVYEMADGATWLESYKKTTEKLSQLGINRNRGFLRFLFIKNSERIGVSGTLF